MQRSREALESLRTIPLFAEVSDGDLEAIASLLIERRFPKHKTIVEEGLPGDYMYVIREGRVKVTKLSGDGREKILELFGPGVLLRRDVAARQLAALGEREDARRDAHPRALAQRLPRRAAPQPRHRDGGDQGAHAPRAPGRRARELALVPAREAAHAGAAPAAREGRGRRRTAGARRRRSRTSRSPTWSAPRARR